jgi:hypothetical protein
MRLGGSLDLTSHYLSSLAGCAEECGSLGLDDAFNLAAGAAAGAFVFGAVVDAVMVLVAAVLIEGVAVRAVGERGAFVPDGVLENFVRRVGDGGPLGARDFVAAFGRVNAGNVQDFGRIEVADAGDGALVEQGDFYGAAARVQAIAKRMGRDVEGIGADFVGVECRGELFWGKQANTSEAATVPVEQLTDLCARERGAETQVLLCWRIGDEHKARHARLEDDGIAGIEMHDDAFSDAADVGDGSADGARAKAVDPRRDRNGATAAGDALDILDARPDDSEDAAAHGFDFGELRHSYF